MAATPRTPKKYKKAAEQALIVSPIHDKHAVLAATHITYEWKAQVLRKVIEMGLTGEGLKDEVPNLTAVIQAIGELNRMQGDYKSTHDASDPIDMEDYKRRISEYQKEY